MEKRSRSGVFLKVFGILRSSSLRKVLEKHREPLPMDQVPCGNARARRRRRGSGGQGGISRIGKGAKHAMNLVPEMRKWRNGRTRRSVSPDGRATRYALFALG